MDRFFSYLITDPEYYSNSSIKFKVILKKAILKHNPEYIVFRDKNSKNIKRLSLSLKDIGRRYNKKVLINSYLDLAKRYRFDGVHLTSTQFSLIKRAKRAKLLTIISTHTLEEVKVAKKFGADFITFSPIFFTPKKGKPKGINRLREATYFSKIPVIALGGIVRRLQIHKVKIKKAAGFASIRYFVNMGHH